MFNATLVNLQHYPLLLSVTTMVAAASLSSRDDLLGPVLLNPRFKLSTMAAEEPAAYAIHPWQLFERDEANALPRWHRGPTDGKYYFAGSHLVRVDLDEVLAVYEPDPDRRSQALDRAEYLTALAQVAAGGRPGMGEFVLRSRHREEPTPVARGVREDLTVNLDSALLRSLFAGDSVKAKSALDQLDEQVRDAASRIW